MLQVFNMEMWVLLKYNTMTIVAVSFPQNHLWPCISVQHIGLVYLQIHLFRMHPEEAGTTLCFQWKQHVHLWLNNEKCTEHSSCPEVLQGMCRCSACVLLSRPFSPFPESSGNAPERWVCELKELYKCGSASAFVMLYDFNLLSLCLSGNCIFVVVWKH